MNRRTFMKFLLGTVASIAVNPIDALSRPAQPMPIPRQPIPEPEPVEPIIEISDFGRSFECDNIPADFGRKRALAFYGVLSFGPVGVSSKTRAEAIQKTSFMQYARKSK